MTLDMNDPLDVLYLECIPHRLTRSAGCLNGPTHQFGLLELATEWVDDDVEVA